VEVAKYEYQNGTEMKNIIERYMLVGKAWRQMIM
jgi:hypothetical protein